MSRGLLGVNIRDVTPDLAATYNLHDNSGALVENIGPSSGAERAGIQVGDVIVSVNEHSVRDSGSLKAAIGLLRPGEKVVVGVIRDGHPLKVNAVLGEAPAAAAHAAPSERPARHRAARSGLRRRRARPTTTPASCPACSSRESSPGSPAAERGLRPGDVITKVNRVRVHNLGEAKRAIAVRDRSSLEVQRAAEVSSSLMR